MGGLGNQLFQYAAARRISYVNNVQLKFDISAFNNGGSRSYCLEKFNVAGQVALPRDIARFANADRPAFVRLYSKWADGLKFYHRRSIVRERRFHFDPSLLKVSGHVYLDGYWQSEKYFKDIQNVIRRELAFKRLPGNAKDDLARRIRQEVSVSLHIRRGDYASDEKVKRVHGECELGYYHTALQKLTGLIRDPHIFVFSDDPQWAQDNLHLSHPVTFVSRGGTESQYEDFRLMTICKHHIIANSSFSWWGAWLSEYPAKVVFAPKAWFKTSERDSKDIVPESWQLI